MATRLTLRRGNSSALSRQPIINGSILFTEDDGMLYLDTDSERFIINGSRVKSNTVAGWASIPDLVGEKDTFYIYTDREVNGVVVPGVKVGDGNAYLIDSPFLDAILMEHINDTDVHITPEERQFWNNKVTCYMDSEDNENIVFTKK